ncbi:MAG: ferrous iron transport protein A [Planctomycetes bacterium]|nr:ferrous iron transport protein A [Planctomycetota bacterium]
MESVQETGAGRGAIPLSRLQKRGTATIAAIDGSLRNFKKFSDVGFIKGQEVTMEQRTLFGGLLRVNVMDTSIAIHRDDADHIMVRLNPCGNPN